MKQNKNKKKWTAAAAALAIIAALAGTFAWFTSEDQTKNHFETKRAGNDTEIVETFDPPKDWKPGQEVNKDVAVQNTGEYNALIRVSLQETLDRLRSGNTEVVNASGLAASLGKGFALYEYTGDLADETTWKTSKFADESQQKVTVNDVEYTLHVIEQDNGSSAEVGNKFKYQAYWQTGEGADAKRYYAKTGPLKRVNGMITVENAGGAEFKLYDAERLSPTPQVDWRTEPYAPTFTIAADGTATIVSALGENGDKLELNFVNLSESPEEGKWYYNAADGYFYYVGVVASGAQTPLLLDSVTLNSNAGNEYGDLKYDLTVNAEGIQAYAEAVDSEQWVNDTNPALVTALKELSLDTPNA